MIIQDFLEIALWGEMIKKSGGIQGIKRIWRKVVPHVTVDGFVSEVANGHVDGKIRWDSRGLMDQEEGGSSRIESSYRGVIWRFTFDSFNS